MPFRENDFFKTTYVTVIAAIVAIGICIIALMGWFFNLPLLTTYQNGWASMKVNTALAIIALGSALLLSTKFENSRLSGILASLICIIGGFTLSEYLFHWDAHIDQLFFKTRTSMAGQYPGRMSIATSALVTFLGISLLFYLFRGKTARLITEILAGISFLIALGSFLGFLYNVEALYKISIFESMSMPTSLSFILIAVGIFFSRPDSGILAPFNKPTDAARTGFRGGLIIISIIFVLSWLQVRARHAGLDDSELGSALLVIIFFISIFFIIWWRTLKLNNAEKERERLYTIKEESETRLKEAQRIAHIGSWELDIITNKLQWSDEIYRIFEMNANKFGASYEAFLDTVHPEDRENVNKAYINSLRKREPYNIEHRLLFPDGRVKYVSEHCKTFYDEDGAPVRSIGTVQDITELKKAEIALVRNEKRFRDLLESTPDAIVIINELGSIVMMNKQACGLFGYTKQELTGQPVELLMPEGLRSRHRKHRDNYKHYPKAREMGKSLELFAIDKQNREFPVEISLSPLITDEGILISAAVRDVSERKKSELALGESYKAIRRLSEHLQNIREEERTRIAREIHDELGQQLTVMMMDVASLEKLCPHNDDKARERLKGLRDLLSRAINSVRRISSELRPSVLDDLGLEVAIELHLKEFGKRSGLHTELILPQHELNLNTQEKTAMFRIFQESLTNIARHSGAKNVKVKLEKTQEHVLLKIEDDGIGYEAKKSKENRTLGILGMQERAAAIGGGYTITGIPGQGTTITASLPSTTK